MNVAIGSDHAGVALKAELLEELRRLGHEPLDLGPAVTTSVDYPDYALKVATEVGSGRVPLGVLICGTGIGMSIAANKVHGVRAALCHTEFEARVARQHNDANVLCLGARVTGGGLAASIVSSFFTAAFEGGRHATRVDKVRAIEAQR